MLSEHRRHDPCQHIPEHSAAHTLKGVAQNLGFQKLYLSSTALTEALRGPKPLTDPALREAVAMDQAALLTAIQELEG